MLELVDWPARESAAVRRGDRGTHMCVLAACVISAVDDGILLLRFRTGVSYAIRRSCMYRERAVNWSLQS